MRHQRSSRAISTHLSTTCVTSGSAITPTFLTSPSPIDRDIASPMRPCAQTRAGRPPLRSETVPPRASMRARSAGKSGLWSWQRSWSSVVISGHQWSSVVISGHQWSSVVISDHQWSSEVIRGHQRSWQRSCATSSIVGHPRGPQRGHQRSSEVIRGHQKGPRRGHQRSSEVISGHQRSSEVIGGHQRSSARRTCAMICPPTRRPRTARESPAHAVQQSAPFRYSTVEVVPHVIAVRPNSDAKSDSSV